MSETVTLYWIRRDFRLQDNAALAAAIERGDPILPVYLLETSKDASWPMGGASKWWLHRALEEAAAGWREREGQLLIRSTADPLDTLLEIAKATNAKRVVWNRRYEPEERECDATVKRGLRDAGIEADSYQNALLVEPHTIGTGEGKPYKVYTPFWKACQKRELPQPVKVPMNNLKVYQGQIKSDAIPSLELLPKHHWYRKMEDSWKVGEQEAQRLAQTFLKERVKAYSEQRDLPAEVGTSRLSPYLHWGHIGPRTLAYELRQTHDTASGGALVYLKELYWREFAYNVLYHFPHTSDQPLRPEFSDFPWQEDDQALRAWQRGETGYPIVDAGMRELYATGWMHNRVRMVVASFLVKHLLQPWQAGARWFWDTLVDADLASNSLGWQWSAGCGADAAPYFRVFNPILQSSKFDPEGDYLKRWLPELSSLSEKHIHAPWEASSSVLSGASVRLGKDYPKPIIDHKAGRERALKAFELFKK